MPHDWYISFIVDGVTVDAVFVHGTYSDAYRKTASIMGSMPKYEYADMCRDSSRDYYCTIDRDMCMHFQERG